jgi:hypothetical protein
MRKTFKERQKKKLKLAIIGMPKATFVEVANSTRELKKRCLHHVGVDDLNHCRPMKIQMRN